MPFISQTSLPNENRVVLTNMTCDSSVQVGDWVRVDSMGVVIRAKADNFSNSNVLGLVEEKSGSTTCNVLVLGISKEIFSSLDVTKEYYLSPTADGEMYVAPVSTLSGSYVLKLGQPVSETKFLVLKGIRFGRS